MKIKLKYLKLNESKELEKFLLYGNKSIMRQILRYIQNDLTTEQIKKFISIRSFEKVFKDNEYECVVKFIFSSYGDLVLEIKRFTKRNIYEEMKQQCVRNFDKGITDDDSFIF